MAANLVFQSVDIWAAVKAFELVELMAYCRDYVMVE